MSAASVPASELPVPSSQPEGVPEWPIGWFDAVIGSWQGEFERPPQGDVEVREEL